MSEGNGQTNDSVRERGDVAALVGLLAPGGSAAQQEQAAVALHLCVDDAKNCDSVRECGGIAALVALLAPGGTAAVQEAAALALSSLG